MLYRFLKIIIGLGINLYYREIRVKNKAFLEHDGPKIILANHPNTLMDAWMVGYVCRDPIYYMAKGTFFNTRLKRWFLHSLGLIPINRAAESKTAGVSNLDSFENCYKLLEKGKTLVIFPEGNSFGERQLRVLKSGAARIALEAERRNGGKLNLRIIPIGLVYSQAEKFRSSVLVSIGEGIDSTPYLENFEKDTLKTSKQLTEKFRIQMETLLVGANSSEHEQLVEEITEILSSEYTGNEKRGVEKDISLIKQIFENIQRIKFRDPQELKQITDLVYRIKWQLNKFEIKSDFLDRNYRPRMFVRQLIFSTVFLLLGLPFYMFGIVHNLLQYKLTDFLVSNMVTDKEYYAPISVLMSLVLYPLVYFGFISLADYVFDLSWWMKLIYFIIMPVMGLFAWFFHKYIGHISFKTNYIFLMSTQKDAVQVLKDDREKLRSLIFEG